MWGLNWLIAEIAVFKDFIQGFYKSEILARRSEWMLTVWMTVLILTSFKQPFFQILKQGLFSLKEFIFGWCLGWLFKKTKI
ncbi:hypothetical protein [Candidatus Phytoplasma sacchari]|uniref:Uncharacterized protein n=1 Tax=Candidatus Phytoplasma sacchari TaxID=2609813 RepID=A0ABY7M357_9MOLU|nr:hypothetical protein O7R10_01805 [Candidatus Phytoplasma sacchari]